jgi:eukaryotic-like serine/threonine-protein kinase
MRGRPQPIEALIELPRAPDLNEQRARWRQAFTFLGQQTRIEGPPPLDGVDVGSLVHSCRTALNKGLADELDWLSRDQALVALYELTTALPAGNERREFGKRVYQGLYGGTAGPFVAVARRMAWSGVRQLETAPMRARVSLCFALPSSSGVNTSPLALALVSGQERFRAWIGEPSTGTLPERRLAARILEQAAQEAVRSFINGDPYPSEWLLGPEVSPTYDRLLADREPLVWQHAARARGILSQVRTALREEIEQALDPGLSPTEWRRALVSLVACIAYDPSIAMGQCRSLLRGGLAQRHPALLTTALWGLPPVVEAEPELALELVEALVDERLSTGDVPLDMADELSALQDKLADRSFAAGAATRVATALANARDAGDDPLVRALCEQSRSRLADPLNPESVSDRVRQAIFAFAQKGALVARDLALQAVANAHQALTHIDPAAPAGAPRSAFAVLTELGTSVLEGSELCDLLLLGHRPGEAATTPAQYSTLLDRLGHLLLQAEQARPSQPPEASPAEASVQRRQLVLFLQLLDTQSPEQLHDDDARGRARARVKESIFALLRNIAEDPDPSVHRVMCAALARSFDAAVRDNQVEPSELLLLVMTFVAERDSVRALMEGSTVSDMRQCLAGYEQLMNSLQLDDDERDTALGQARDVAQSVIVFSGSLAARGSYRSEALRQVLLRMGRALDAIAQARGLAELVADDQGNRNWLDDLEQAVQALLALSAGAVTRLRSPRGSAVPEPNREPALDSAIDQTWEPLSRLLERTVSAGTSLPRAEFTAALKALLHPLPDALASALRLVVGRLVDLPARLATRVSAIPLKTRRAALPEWLLPRRTIGGFYVMRALGTGGVSTVFVAKRLEERRNPEAETYALKVPHYDPSTARSLSEQEFMEMFRGEAGALLSLPQHPNLSGFVTFDMAAKPKPILVMELIQGQALERLILRRTLTVPQVFKYLDGILSGLGAMHGMGIAHLDVKPSNVILRNDSTPVLVDFGLSGRQLRPGCGTLEYCAPEVLGVVPEGYEPDPTRADIYAFACMAYEMLTGKLLFDGDSEQSIMNHHVSHDGWPAELAQLGEQDAWRPMAVVLGACLRRDPRNRPSTFEVRAALQKLLRKVNIDTWSWPLLQGETEATHLSA